MHEHLSIAALSRLIVPPLLASVALTGAGTAVAAADKFAIGGDVVNPTTYSYASSPMPPLGLTVVTETIGANTYKGVSLYGLLTAPGVGIKPDPVQVKNGILSQYVVAAGADGYRVVYSGGELDPAFGGNAALPVMVAYELNGGPIGAKGAFRTPTPEDGKGGRNVQNLTRLTVYDTPPRAAPGGAPSSFTLSGLVTHGGSFSDLSGLGLPTLTESVSYVSGGKTISAGFQGVSLWAFLNHGGLVTDPSQPSTHLGEYVLATGSDGYRAVFSIGELDPSFGGASAGSGQEDLIAWAKADASPLGGDGYFQLVVPGDVKGGRYVHNLVSLEVLAAPVPEPESAALLLAGLSLFASLARRRRAVSAVPA